MILRLIDRHPRGPNTEDRYFAVSGRLEMMSDLVEEMGRPDWTVDLVLVDDETMVGLNQGFRQAEGVTDVLSFSYLEENGEGVCDLAVGDGYALADRWLEKLGPEAEIEAGPVAGEVVLAPDFIARRCRENSWPLDHEMPMLLVHGLLHILGWDHTDDSETEAMRTVEQGILAAAGLPHPLRERS